MVNLFRFSLALSMAATTQAFTSSASITNRCLRRPSKPFSRITTIPKMEAFESIQQIFSKTFIRPAAGKGSSKALENKERNNLKHELLRLSRSAKPDRLDVEKLMYKLSPLSPVKDSATSPLLRKEWLLVWTTEKEINFFKDFNLCSLITQTISDNDNKQLENLIQFQNGGYLGVAGSLSVDGENTQRTNFQFVSAQLDLGWGIPSFNLPPVGKGWFDTIYLDEDLRVDINSRDDILICVPMLYM